MSNNADAFSTKKREALFLSLATRPEGTTAQEVFEAAKADGDSVTPEAYHNLARRLAHRGLLIADRTERQTRYKTGSNIDAQWLDEEQIASIIDPEYPLIALTALRESTRQLLNVPEEIWTEARERLKTVSARKLFTSEIKEYCENLLAELESLGHEIATGGTPKDIANLRQEAESSLMLLNGITKFGLGLSKEAVNLPQTVDIGVKRLARSPGETFYNEAVLEDEISRRIADEPIVVDIPEEPVNSNLLIAAVDGSSRGGLLFQEGEGGDLSVGIAPMISINTAVAHINRNVRHEGREFPAFIRLPEKPEDMQQRDNRYTIMAKLFFPDLSDSKYMHSVWNAMDVLETKATHRAMSRWYTSKTNIEVRPADLIMRDGTIVPNDRDFYHYKQQDSYGRIVRDLIELNWEVAKKVDVDDQTVSGVVKHSELRILAPIINRYLCNLAATSTSSQLRAWPLRSMNLLPDQVLLTRLLTAKRTRETPWWRTCVIIRPFHATTNYSLNYSREPGSTPPDRILQKAARALENQEDQDGDDSAAEDVAFWTDFRRDRDPYIQMLRKVSYASTYIAAVPRLDVQKSLPRFEFILPSDNREEGSLSEPKMRSHLRTVIHGLRLQGFEVSAEHSMFADPAKLDVLPALVIRAHDTVKIWANELLSRVQEYVGYMLSKYLPGGKLRGVRIRPWTKRELESWIVQMQAERNARAGGSSAELPASPRLELEDDQGSV